MKKSAILYMLVTFMIFVTACSSGNDDHSSDSKLVKINVNTVQQVLLPERAILIDAHVTQGDMNIKDANDVEIEIWRKDSDKHEMITASHWLDGVYRIQTSFPKSGIYYMKAHVKDNGVDITTLQKEIIVDNVIPAM